jgi:hypothetical protein
MKRMMNLLGGMVLVVANMAHAAVEYAMDVEYVPIKMSGAYSVPIDNLELLFEAPGVDRFKANYAKKIVTRDENNRKYSRMSSGHYLKSAFNLSRNFYWMDIPLFGIDAQFHLTAQVHIRSSVETRAAFVDDTFKGDFSKPAELKSYLERNRGVTEHSTPVEEVIINGRKWYRYWWNSFLYPDDLVEHYFTGLAPDRFLEVYVRQYPVPFVESRYPTYPTEDRMPRWMKETHKFKEQVINSLRIGRVKGSNEPDLYAVEDSSMQITPMPRPNVRPTNHDE